MEFKSFGVLFSCLVLFVCAVMAQSAPNNSTTPVSAKPGIASTNGTTALSNSTTSGNKTASSEEDCEAEPEPIAGAGDKNATKTGERQGKQLTPGDKEKYKHDGAAPEPEAISKTNATANAANPGGDAAKLQGNSSTTTAAPPATAGAITTSSSLWANVIFATLLSSFASYSVAL